MNQADADEMLVSLLSRTCKRPCRTIPGAANRAWRGVAAEALVFGGQPQPSIPPRRIKDTLANPVTSGGRPTPLAALQSLRDKTLAGFYDLYKSQATPAQRAYIDSFIVPQEQARASPRA